MRSNACLADRILADEEAKEAKLRKEQENRELGMRMKADAKEGEAARQAAHDQLQAKHRSIVAEIQSQRDRPQMAKVELARRHKKEARELRRDLKEMEATKQAEREKEAARRADLIKQIKALEMVPRRRDSRLDPTYTPQIGLLEEMSLAELRERLLIVEEQRQEDEDHRRAKINAAKRERETDLAQRASRLAEMRQRAASEASAKREHHRTDARNVEERHRERLLDAQLKVKETLETKRAARLQKEAELAAELQRIRIKNQFLEADKGAVERKKWESQLSGEQREIIVRQRVKQDVAQSQCSVYNKETQQRLLNVQREREAHEAFLREYEAHFADASETAASDELEVVVEQVTC